MITLPEQVARLISRLEEYGHEAFIVGGCVRDSLMRRKPNDWDICTSARPEEMLTCFQDFRVLETGLKHGTLTVLVDGQPFEITTYRIDGNYSDGRHPDQVLFTADLTKDLSRRDFTINAMAWHPSRGLIDPFSGAGDLKQGCIRCVGEAKRRFQEDALRIMRAVRFSSQLGFEIEEKTENAMSACLPLLENVSAERLRVEFDKLLCGPAAGKTLNSYPQVIAALIPEIRPMFGLGQRTRHHIYTVWEHTVHAVSNIRPVPALRLCAFFHDIGKPKKMTVDEDGCGHFYKHELLSEAIADRVLLRLKYDNWTREIVTEIIRNHSIVFCPTPKQARRLLAKLGEEKLRMLIDLEIADVKSQNPLYCEERLSNIFSFEKTVEQVLAAKECFSLRSLAIGGRELLELGIPQGPRVGEILNLLLQEVMNETLSNEREALIAAVKELAENKME